VLKGPGLHLKKSFLSNERLRTGGGATLREHVKVVEIRQLCHFVILALGLSQAVPKGVTSLTVSRSKTVI
jgi:hypothetical protein